MDFILNAIGYFRQTVEDHGPLFSCLTLLPHRQEERNQPDNSDIYFRSVMGSGVPLAPVSLQMCQRTAALRFRLKHRPQEDGRLFRFAH
jgi:hypothetical protein